MANFLNIAKKVAKKIPGAAGEAVREGAAEGAQRALKDIQKFTPYAKKMAQKVDRYGGADMVREAKKKASKVAGILREKAINKLK